MICFFECETEWQAPGDPLTDQVGTFPLHGRGVQCGYTKHGG